MTDTVTVSKVTQLHRVAVIELSAGGGAPFEDAMRAARSQARIIVVDCLKLGTLPPEFIDDLARVQADLRPQGGHLIVVNAPDGVIGDLRFVGIDAATTTDLQFDATARSRGWTDDGDVLGA